MGCTPSRPTGVEPEYQKAGESSPPVSNGGRQTPTRQDSGRSLRSTGSAKRRGQRGRTPSATTPNGSNSSRHDSSSNHHHNQFAQENGGGHAVISPTSDPRWIHLWKTHRDLLLDPADVHATVEACMARVTNKLGVTEITFLQRKVRSIVRASNQSQEKGTRMTNILRSNTTSSQEQEIKAIAEKYHLLSSHVVRKVLPKLPVPAGAAFEEPINGMANSNHHSNGGSTSGNVVADNVFLLCLFLHESLWGRVAAIADSSAKEAGVETDVNKYHLPEETPPPVPPKAADVPEVPVGISLHSLSFIIGLALRGSRMQRLQLLFYLLLPARMLHAFLEQHPAGGPPLWLLEVGSDMVLSMASLSHYYYFGDTFSPAGDDSSTSKIPEKATENNGDYRPPEFSRLALDGKMLISLIQSILVPPSDQVSDGAITPNPMSPDTPSNGSKSPIMATGATTQKKTKMRRRASNQFSEDDVTIRSPQTEIMDRLSSEPTFNLYDYVDDDLTLQATLAAAAEELEKKDKVSMSDFMEFCQRALDDDALDAIMYRFFGHSILPSPSMELELVLSRWREWQETECVLYTKALEEPESTFEMLTQSVRKILLMQKEESIEASTERGSSWSPWKPFGGIGGFDGRGGMGFGVMYCIDKKWWSAWESYVGWTWAGESSFAGTNERKRTRRRPEGLSSEPLLDRFDDEIIAGTGGSYELMKIDLIKEEDYVLVPAGVWDTLYELYGGGPPLPRMVLPPSSDNSRNTNPIGLDACAPMSSSGPELRTAPSENQLDAMASTDNSDRVLRIPRQMEVNTHPWVLHFHICDPQQPYRRGDAGPLSIRVMASPDQPLWRLYAEIVVRLPFHLYRAFGSDGRGKARFWKRTDPAGPKTPTTFGPWTILCKNRFAILPKRVVDEEFEHNFEELKENWKAYADNASVESIGLVNGDQVLVECAFVNRSGELIWPREAAAKAGRVKRLADRDMKFRQLLRGVDESDKPLATPPDLVGMRVDAMDSSGKWFQVEISEVQIVAADTDEEDDSMEMENHDPRKDNGESKQVLVDFSEHGGHTEWIDVESDRLASAGRFTLGSEDDPPEAPEKPVTAATGTGTTDIKVKPQAQVKKATDTSESNGKLCTIPGYGACGLANLGNTCYANSAIQCVSYLPLLRAYLLSLQYKATGDLNKDNPLGTEGKLLEEFAELLRQMWSAKIGEKSPTRFRAALGKANELFQGADQQDSQEFLSFILDALHEDSNRVRKKPPVDGLEDDWKKKTSLSRVGEEEWRRYLRRNRSIMADVSMGQVLNTVTCPVCNFSSRNFDPFNLLSLPFPTVADVIFKCFVVRRASAYNTPWLLNKPRKGGKARVRFVRRDLVPNPKPPSVQLVVEEYIIAMSRLADSGDLKLQIQNLTGIPSSALSVCRGETVSMKDKKDDSVVRTHSQVTLLPDKEAPCSQLANRQRANSEDIASAPTTPTLIVAFESTLRSRPQDDKKDEDSSDSNTEEDDDEQAEKKELTKKELSDLERQVELYGNHEECRLFDTETVAIAKALSRSLWPRTEIELKLGLRVDAIDHKNHWFPGSVVEIIESAPAKADGEAQADSKENDGTKIKVRIHFDNFSSKWDEMYTIEHFKEGRVRPLYSHAAPRLKPTEFIVHHRFTDRNSRLSNLFGQSFYVQCHNEWTTARAGAQILAQAGRFLKLPSEFSGAPHDESSQEREAKVQRLYDRTQAVISDLIDLLIECDREYVHCALGVATDPHADPELKVERFQNPSFDASSLSQNLIKKVGALLHRLPFEVRVCTIDSTLGGTNEELAFPFSLMRTIGNYMNARHAIVLQWREPPSDKKATNGRPSNYVGAPVMYVSPPVAIDAGSADILNSHKSKRSPNSRGSGGLPLGVCLTEYCKLQQLPTWRCPKCKDFRDGKQNMALWRLPDLLTIHLKRFNCSARWREKITAKVNFPLTGLDLTEWCHQESPSVGDSTSEACVYDLVGVLNHFGGMTGGHYVATCKASVCSRDGSEEVAYDFGGVGASKPVFPDNELESDVQSGWKFGRQKSEVNQKRAVAISTAKAAAESAEPLWLQFDDELVEPIPPRHVISETAYVLFYRRRRITPANIAKYSTLE